MSAYLRLAAIAAAVAGSIAAATVASASSNPSAERGTSGLSATGTNNPANPFSAPAPGGATTTTTSTTMTTGADLVDTMKSTGMHNTLAAAVSAAQREQMLRDPGPYTVFAPTDDAFKALPPGTVETLLKPENQAKLQAILAYHVIPGTVMSGDIPSGMMDAKSAQGGSLRVNKTGQGVMVNDARVIKADVATSNGVVHVIDKVLMPE